MERVHCACVTWKVCLEGVIKRGVAKSLFSRYAAKKETEEESYIVCNGQHSRKLSRDRTRIGGHQYRIH